MGLVTSTDHDTSGDDSVNRITTEHEQLEKHLQPQQQQQQQQKQQQPADDRRRRRLERDKAVARVSRMKLRQQQQQQLLQLRRRAGSQPNVARRNLTDVVPPPRAVDDMMTANDDGDEITEDGPLEGVTPTKSFAQQSIACVEIESKKKMAKSSTNLGDIEQNERYATNSVLPLQVLPHQFSRDVRQLCSSKKFLSICGC